MQYAIIDSATNKVINVIEWDGAANYTPPEGVTIIQSDTASCQGTYDPNTQTFAQPE